MLNALRGPRKGAERARVVFYLSMSPLLKRDVPISLACVITTIMFDVVTLAVTDKSKLQDSPGGVLAVQFDLLLIALSILVAAHVNTASAAKKAYVFMPTVVSIIGIVACLMLVAISGMPWNPFKPWVFSTFIPDIIALGILGVAVHAAWEVR